VNDEVFLETTPTHVKLDLATARELRDRLDEAIIQAEDAERKPAPGE
jgi:hypothetical protein